MLTLECIMSNPLNNQNFNTMKLRTFGVVYETKTIVIQSRKDGKGYKKSYTIKYTLLKERRMVFVTLPNRVSAKREVIRLLALYTDLTATERLLVATRRRK